ncbi:MAG: hypothetical protein ACK544_13670 [Microcystis sp.]|jgi:hypothetical protein|uniref:Uncharacterized protein n=1 Tax=Microcystis aeruginosa G11-04 TaxID=2685956 RepID=A0A966L7F3_MICAE|nr:hypothetical protein [Microcystis aeruginosa W13-16]NCQ76381.1 hypothetical protein [Microcystis aeruginosa W13-13]NCQ80921.1 hypothetical protein [Microcystis aeruginosa W13-15]NCR15471.1 hypothetical protein [Microcystis aeruginosa SX13-11]NCR19917.1 hypothetical protein [Microcystis aeruginosa LL13-03]NCR24546.1 hypothetical protein [Microcystis aeruginosa L111-01]NCR29048.1 hypothetical protein [Microcystis aeruginosa LE13-04]NCR45711.1 hypothetical protein [Microcystis aeruginosa SX1
MNNIEIKQKINKKLDLLNTEELTLIDNLLNQITSFLKIKTPLDISSKDNFENEDPLADLRNSDFIGCFSGEPDLAEKAEEIAQGILSRKDVK